MPRRAAKRDEVYWYYVAHIKIHGYAPTLKEAAAATGSSDRYVYRCVSHLVSTGLLAYHPQKVWRGIVLPDERSAA